MKSCDRYTALELKNRKILIILEKHKYFLTRFLAVRSWSWASFLRYPDKEDRKRIEKNLVKPRAELNYQIEANTPGEINDLLNDINKLRNKFSIGYIFF